MVMQEQLNKINELALWDYEVERNEDGFLLILSRIRITAESMLTTSFTEFEIRATGLELRLGKVYYYDRENLQPGERIASPRAITSPPRPNTR